jgi:hypothetical protein
MRSRFGIPAATVASLTLCLSCSSGTTDPSEVLLSVVNVSEDSIGFSLASYGAGTVTDFDPEPFPASRFLQGNFGFRGLLAPGETTRVPLPALGDYRMLTGITAGVFRVQTGTARLSNRITVLLNDIKADGYTVRLSTAP